MRFFSGARLGLSCLILCVAACGGSDDDEAGLPASRKVTPKGSGGSSAGSSGSGLSGGLGGDGSGNSGGDGSGNSGGNGSGNSGGNTNGGNTNGGNTNGGNTNGGNTNGGNTNGGNTNGGNTNGGNTNGGTGGVVEGKCTSKVDCNNFPERPFCNIDISLCVECLENTDCTSDPDEKVCDKSNGMCIECLMDSDCIGHANGPHCNKKTSRCVCKENSECTSSPKGKLCDVDGLQRCAECITSFDCKDPNKPGCSLDDVCFKGDFCTGDDPEEVGDDGPLGAVDITPSVLDGEDPPLFPPWISTLENRHVCNLPVEESDWYKFQVQARDAYEISVEWGDAKADLDLVVTDSIGRLYGYNYNGRPAKVKLTYLPAGTYYAFVYRAGDFDKLSATTTTYTIKTARYPENGKCMSSADCAESFSSQFFRGSCESSGVCSFIQGNGKLGVGALCDDDKDCEKGNCSYQPFTRNAHSRSFCSVLCDEEGKCPSNWRCATYLLPEICMEPCSSSDECHASLGSVPPAGEEWDYLTCDKDTGDCQ